MSTYYLWLDLETTGLDADDDVICEVAAILTEDAPGFVELDRFSAPVREYEYIAKRLAADEFVTKMHETSGLRMAMNDGEQADTIRSLDECVESMLSKHLGSKLKGKVILAGSGVSHFDLQRVTRWMPDTRAWLYWRPLDVGQLEEWRILAGLPTFDEANPDEAARKTHRAADDIAYHLDEARFYLANWAAAAAVATRSEP